MAEDQHKVKIKINGQEKNFDEEKPKEDLIVHDWRSKLEIAAASEKAEQKEPSLSWLKKIKRNRLPKRKINGTSKFSPALVIVSTISAILIGIVLGIILLQLMVKNPEEHQKNAAGGNLPNGNEEVILPEVDLFILQQGIYEQEASVRQLEQEFERNDIPFASINDQGQFRVFVAVMDSLETGKQLKDDSLLSETFSETWPTAIHMNEKIIQKLTADEKKFLEMAYPMYEQIVKATNHTFLQGGDGQAEGLKTDIDTIKGFENINQEPIKELQQSLISAYEELMTYIEKKENAHWFRAQNYLLQFVEKYYLL